jgi:putative DNA primase/helicase
LVNIGDDISDGFIPNSSVFKKLVSGNRVSFERKGKDPFEFENYAKMLFSANNLPRLGRGKDSAAIMRRLVIVPFNARFLPDDEDYDPFIRKKLAQSDAMEYLILKGIEALRRVLITNKFTESAEVVAEKKAYAELNNPLVGFVYQHEDLAHKTTEEVYHTYAMWCCSSGIQALSRLEFTRQICTQFGYRSLQRRIEGKRYYVFERTGQVDNQ